MSAALTPVPPPARTTGAGAWVELVKPAADLAKAIALTDFVPKSFRENKGEPYSDEQAVASVTACILFGAELGIGPMQALAKIAIIEGRPAPSAELARALVLADGHDIWVEEATTTRVVMAGKRANSAHVQKVTWTMDDAKKAGLAGKQNWQRYPRQMLLARCSVELARMVAPDSLGGISVFAEELDDGAPVRDMGDPKVLSEAGVEGSARKKNTRRLAAAVPTEVAADTVDVPLPPLPDEAPAEPPQVPAVAPAPAPAAPLPPLPDEDVPALALAPEPTTAERAQRNVGAPPSRPEPGPPAVPADGPTDAQIRKLMASYNAFGVRDRADQKRLTAELLGLATLGSHKDLTSAEASTLIDMVGALGPDDIWLDEDGRPQIVSGDGA